MALTGTYTALITPFTGSNQEVDWKALKKLVQQQVQGKIEGLVPCGTTGESPTLTHEEHREVIAKTVEWAKAENSATKIIAGTGSNSTREAVELTRAAAADGADYALLVNPYYNKPTQEGLFRHFSTIADASPVPVILYNIPGRTAVSLDISTISRLSLHPNIVGIKEATGDLGFMLKVRQNTPDDFSLLSGDDNLILPVLSIGGRGVISVVANILPRATGEITRQYLAGEVNKASEIFYTILPLAQNMFVETNPIPVKFAAMAEGLCENILRLPLTSLSAEKEEGLRKILAEVKGKL